MSVVKNLDNTYKFRCIACKDYRTDVFFCCYTLMTHSTATTQRQGCQLFLPSFFDMQKLQWKGAIYKKRATQKDLRNVCVNSIQCNIAEIDSMHFLWIYRKIRFRILFCGFWGVGFAQTRK